MNLMCSQNFDSNSNNSGLGLQQYRVHQPSLQIGTNMSQTDINSPLILTPKNKQENQNMSAIETDLYLEPPRQKR